MKWEDKGILISAKKFGETDIIATFITSEHGLSNGLIKGGISKKQKPYLQIGNSFNIIWKSRLEEQLGFFAFESTQILGTILFNNPLKLQILSSLCTLLYDSLAENQNYHNLYLQTKTLIDNLQTTSKDTELLLQYIIWEKNLLSFLGFALNLDKCNATGTTENLCYISPKTGHAICKTAGEPYKDKLLPLPKIWKKENELYLNEVCFSDLKEALQILSFFFEQRIYFEKNKPFPFIRKGLENL
ncbi:DNA repair protein RecO [bacterium]|nr:DNA repair protein RecO [bacterium]